MGVTVARRAGARIAIAGAGSANGAARSFLRAELAGIRLVNVERTDELSLELGLRDTDMLVFVADASETADGPRTAAIGAAARDRGILVAAIVVDPGHAETRPGLLAVLRDAADMVMIVREAADVHAVVAALR